MENREIDILVCVSIGFGDLISAESAFKSAKSARNNNYFMI